MAAMSMGLPYQVGEIFMRGQDRLSAGRTQINAVLTFALECGFSP